MTLFLAGGGGQRIGAESRWVSEELEVAFVAEQARLEEVGDTLAARWKELEGTIAFGRSQH